MSKLSRRLSRRWRRGRPAPLCRSQQGSTLERNPADADDVSQVASRQIAALSGDERDRVLLARAPVGEPRNLIADEPMERLDPAHAIDAMTRLRSTAEIGSATCRERVCQYE